MTAQADLEADVQRGFDLLDTKGPINWPNRIDRNRLNLESPTDCIAGQLYGSFASGMDALSPFIGFRTGMAGKEHLAIWYRRIGERIDANPAAPAVVPAPVRERELVAV